MLTTTNHSHFTMRTLLVALVMLVGMISANAATEEHTTWKWEQKLNGAGTEGTLTFNATITKGWHLYGFNILEQPCPVPLKFTFENVQGAELQGEVTPARPTIKKYDETFEKDVYFWENEISFTQKFKVTNKDSLYISGYIDGQACIENGACQKFSSDFEFGDPSLLKAAAPALNNPADGAQANPAMSSTTEELWAPVNYPKTDETVTQDTEHAAWWEIIIWGFVGGLIALVTPCVWPLIPMTVSFFLKKNKARKEAVKDAIIYGASIVIIFVILGLAITLIFGASKLNELATNAVFNICFFLLLVLFGISFLGGFDIKLPSSWSNKMDSKVDSSTGLLSIFFMAFTLVLVSFSCTGPIIGTLLVQVAANGDIFGPLLGMTFFALALAIPFALFAIFPSMLQNAAKSGGGWMNSVKVVLGFLELALSLKFLSVADLAYGWRILDREVFVSLWVVIFALLGFYLFGKIMFSHDTKVEKVSMPRFILGTISLAFAVYLLPGLWGAPLKTASAFVPPLNTQDFNLYETGEDGEFKEFDNFDECMAYAQENGKPVFVDFTGYGCVNCRKMEGAVFNVEDVDTVLKNNFVMVKLYVDEKKPLAAPEKVKERDGKVTTLRTVGDKWSYLQRYKFDANSQPFYVILNPDGQTQVGSYAYDEDVPKFVKWLNSGLTKFHEFQANPPKK